MVILLAITEKKMFPLTLSRAISLNRLEVLGVLLLWDEDYYGTLATLMRVCSNFSILGQYSYNLYGIPFGPGADKDLANRITCLTSLSLGVLYIIYYIIIYFVCQNLLRIKKKVKKKKKKKKS